MLHRPWQGTRNEEQLGEQMCPLFPKAELEANQKRVTRVEPLGNSPRWRVSRIVFTPFGRCTKGGRCRSAPTTFSLTPWRCGWSLSNAEVLLAHFSRSSPVRVATSSTDIPLSKSFLASSCLAFSSPSARPSTRPSSRPSCRPLISPSSKPLSRA